MIYDNNSTISDKCWTRSRRQSTVMWRALTRDQKRSTWFFSINYAQRNVQQWREFHFLKSQLVAHRQTNGNKLRLMLEVGKQPKLMNALLYARQWNHQQVLKKRSPKTKKNIELFNLETRNKYQDCLGLVGIVTVYCFLLVLYAEVFIEAELGGLHSCWREDQWQSCDVTWLHSSFEMNRIVIAVSFECWELKVVT